MNRLKLMFDGLLDRLDFVADNGARVLVGQREIASQELDRQDVLAVLTYIKEQLRKYPVMVSSGEASFYQEGATFELPEQMVTPEQAKAFQAVMTPLADLSQDLPEGISVKKITLIVDEIMCDQVLATINGGFNQRLLATTSGFGAIDILPAGIDKAFGLKQLLSYYGYDSSQLMAFGDGGNDVTMLELAGESYAMTNAPAFVQERAKQLAPSHREDGVLLTIESFLDHVSIKEES